MSKRVATGALRDDADEARRRLATKTMLEDLPGIDVAAGLRQTMGNGALYVRLLAEFRDANRQTVQALREALAAAEPKRVRYLAHTLRGQAATLGLSGVADCARNLESAPADSPASAAAADRLIELDRELSRVLAGLERLPAEG